MFPITTDELDRFINISGWYAYFPEVNDNINKLIIPNLVNMNVHSFDDGSYHLMIEANNTQNNNLITLLFDDSIDMWFIDCNTSVISDTKDNVEFELLVKLLDKLDLSILNKSEYEFNWYIEFLKIISPDLVSNYIEKYQENYN